MKAEAQTPMLGENSEERGGDVEDLLMFVMPEGFKAEDFFSVCNAGRSRS